MSLVIVTTTGVTVLRNKDDSQCREFWPSIKILCLGKLHVRQLDGRSILECNQCSSRSLIVGQTTERPLGIQPYAESAPPVVYTTPISPKPKPKPKPKLSIVSTPQKDKP